MDMHVQGVVCGLQGARGGVHASLEIEGIAEATLRGGTDG